MGSCNGRLPPAPQLLQVERTVSSSFFHFFSINSETRGFSQQRQCLWRAMGCLPGHLISHHYWEGACPGPPRTARCPQPPSQGDTEARRVQPGRPSAGPSGAGRSRSAHACGHTQREPWTLPCTINHHKPSCPQPLKLPGALGQRDPYTGLDGGRVAWQPTQGPSGTPPASQEGEQSGPGAQRRRAEEGGPQRSVLLGKPWACEPRPCPPGLVNHAPPTHTLHPPPAERPSQPHGWSRAAQPPASPGSPGVFVGPQ